MAEQSNTAPQIADFYSPLETIAFKALRIYGDFNPGTVDGDVLLMFVDFANQVIDEVRAHPYWRGGGVDYYASPTERRAIPDHIMMAGLLAKYAEQQFSDKYQLFAPKYARTMNQLLWYILNGNTEIALRRVDEKAPTNPTNGQPLA
jgi:hypothetical protein